MFKIIAISQRAVFKKQNYNMLLMYLINDVIQVSYLPLPLVIFFYTK